MKTILIASLLALTTDPATGAPSCEDLLAEAEREILVCEDDLIESEDGREVSHNAIQALVASILQLTSSSTGATGGGGAVPCNTQICQIADSCRGSANLGQCVETECLKTPNNCL